VRPEQDAPMNFNGLFRMLIEINIELKNLGIDAIMFVFLTTQATSIYLALRLEHSKSIPTSTSGATSTRQWATTHKPSLI
jgi:hypothetical protein